MSIDPAIRVWIDEPAGKRPTSPLLEGRSAVTSRGGHLLILCLKRNWSSSVAYWLYECPGNGGSHGKEFPADASGRASASPTDADDGLRLRSRLVGGGGQAARVPDLDLCLSKRGTRR